MKLIIAGSRTIRLSVETITGLLTDFDVEYIDEVVSGTAPGMDQSGELFAEHEGLHLSRFPANWDEEGKAAGHIRNARMAEYGTRLFLVWDGSSKGSANMKEEMLKRNKPVYEVILRKHNV